MMKKLLKDPLRADPTGKLARRLAGANAKTHMVLPQPLLDRLRQAAPDGAWSGATSLDTPLAHHKRRVIVHSPEDERGLIERTQAAWPDVEVWGLLHHVLPGWLTGHLRAPPPSVVPALPDCRFAVVCAPRAGSTYLCELLAAVGVGDAQEHLREPLVNALRTPGVDHAAMLRRIVGLGQVRGVFGTKLIGHFLFDVAGQALAGAALSRLAEEGFRFLALRRDPVDQAVSNYVAMASGVWHQHGAVAAEAAQSLAAVPFDPNKLLKFYRAGLEEAQLLARALSAVPPELVLTLDHDDLGRHPLTLVDRVCKHLGCNARVEADLSQLPVSLAAAVPAMGAMSARLRGLLAASELPAGA
jgi:LPS sulfotransferase NodH